MLTDHTSPLEALYHRFSKKSELQPSPHSAYSYIRIYVKNIESLKTKGPARNTRRKFRPSPYKKYSVSSKVLFRSERRPAKSARSQSQIRIKETRKTNKNKTYTPGNGGAINLCDGSDRAKKKSTISARLAPGSHHRSKCDCYWLCCNHVDKPFDGLYYSGEIDYILAHFSGRTGLIEPREFGIVAERVIALFTNRGAAQ